MSANQQPHLAAAPAPLTTASTTQSATPIAVQARTRPPLSSRPQRSTQGPAQDTSLSSPAHHTAGEVCPSCGGSGMLRLGDQRFRTCLDCLGQGRLSGAAAATVAEVVPLDSRRLNAAASSVAAR